ncbi:MAG: hypothetical protein JSS89_12170 [Bacteroidetes bacterium]|nr:hypothetical protein [Bacteroidota bacterium]
MIGAPSTAWRTVKVAWIALAFGIAVGIGIMRSCDGLPQYANGGGSVRTVVKRTIDSVPYPVYLDSIRTVVRLKREYAFIPADADTLRLMQAIAMRDSLATLLAASRVRIPFHGDTILSDTHDSIDVECDEVSRMARVRVRHGVRNVMLQRVTDSVLTERSAEVLPAWSIDIGAGMAIGLDGVPRPVVYLGISKPLFAIRP